MIGNKRSLWIVGFGAAALCAAAAAHAQDNAIGPPQLKDFQLEPRERIVTQPAPTTQPPAQPTAQPPAARQQPPAPRAAEPRPQPATGTERPTAAPAPRSAPPAQAEPLPVPAFETPAPASTGALPEEVPPAPARSEPGGGFPWLYAIPVAALALLGAAFLRRRRRAAEIARAAAPLEAAAPPPRPEPQPRPWLELSLKAERASATPTETVVLFELEIANSGKSAARNLRIDVKMFNAGREQDKEIGAFFRTAGRESTKCSLPGIAAGETGMIRGEVTMPREEMRAVQLSDRLLFIPVIAVNTLYDWGDGRTGQTSRSYVIGRELQEPSEKMGAFRVDQGPRIWRTVGQRPHKLARRV